MAKNIKVEFDSNDVTSYLKKCVKTETYGYSVAVYEMEFAQQVNDVVTIEPGVAVEVYLDSSTPPTTLVFKGQIDDYKEENGVMRVTCKDELAKLIDLEVTQVYDKNVPSDPSYPDGKISDIFIDIVETYGGLDTNSGATVQDSGTDVVLSKFVCNHADPFERCKKLAETLNWVFYYRADTDYVYFEPKNYTVNSNTLTVGGNVVKIPTWEFDKSEMINIVRVEGANQLVQTFELFSGDASETEFDLTNIPQDLAVFYDASTNFSTTARTQADAETIDVKDATGTHTVEVDRERKKIEFITFTPASATNNILVEYSYIAPIPVRLKNSASISQYGTYEKTVGFTDVDSLDDAWKRGENILAKYANPFKSAKLTVLWTNSLGLRVGQQIRVVDSVSQPTIDQDFTIYKTRDYWPENITEIEVGDKQFTIDEYQANVLERVKRLEQSLSSSGVAVTEIESVDVEFNVLPDTTDIGLELINDGFTLGDTSHYDNGILHSGAVDSEAFILEEMEDHTNWTGTNATLGNDSTVGHFWIGTQGVSFGWVATGSPYMEQTGLSYDMSNASGSASGAATKGTVGLWVYTTDEDKVSSITLRISDGTNYQEFTGEHFAQKEYVDTSFALSDGRTYVLFDLDDPSNTSGTLDWTSVTTLRVTCAVTDSGSVTFDYLTCNESDKIGLNGLGDRVTTYSTTTETW